MTGPYASAAVDYFEAGFSPLPLLHGHKKHPPRGFTGWSGADPDLDQVKEWCDEHGARNIAIRLPADLVAIDVDGYGDHRGGDTIARLVGELGQPGPTVCATARDLPSGKFLYRVPAGTQLQTSAGPGVDIIQRRHRYAVVWPSVHAEAGLVRWIDILSGEVIDGVPPIDAIPDLPWPWIEHLSVNNKAAMPEADDDAVGRWRERDGARCLPRLEALVAKVREASPGGRHDATLWGLCRVAEGVEGGDFPAEVAEREMREAWAHITAGENRDDEFDSMLRWAVGQIPATRGEAVSAEQHDPPAIPPNLPAELWTRRPELAVIRQAAESRLIAPDAVLGATLARVAQHLDYRIVIPPTVGRWATPNVNVGIVAQSGGGKGAAIDTAEELLEVDAKNDRVRRVPAGSGEGMVRAFFREVGEGRKKETVRGYDSVLIRVDEGELFANLQQRNGQTTLQVLRQGWSGEHLGGSYATREKNLHLDQHDYRWALVCGVQPELAGPLIDDTAGGDRATHAVVRRHPPRTPR